MALITSCQASFQNVAGYEDDIAAIQENVRECYSEISKSSEQIRLAVREDYISRSEMATIQQDFQSTITQNSSEIRMDFSTITDELKDNITTNQELLEEYIRFKGALIELGKVGNAFTAELSNNELAFKENGQKIAYISNNSLVITNAEVRNKLSLKSGGKGVAVGKVSETDNCFEVSEKWDVKVYGKLLKDYIKEFTGALYPVGSIYMSVKNTNPSTYFGGTWVAWGTGRVPVGVNANDTNFATVEKTGGASAVTLTTAQMPSHTHAKGTLTTASTGGHTHDLKNQKASWGTSGGNRVLIDATSGYTAVSNKTTTSAGSHSHTISGSTAAAGSGNAHNNLQPYITCYMWKRTA